MRSYHGHQLCNGGVGQTQLVDHSWQNGCYSPTADCMKDPDEKKADQCWVMEERLYLLGIPRLGQRAGLSVGKIVDDCLLLLCIEELGRIGVVGKKEECEELNSCFSTIILGDKIGGEVDM